MSNGTLALGVFVFVVGFSLVSNGLIGIDFGGVLAFIFAGFQHAFQGPLDTLSGFLFVGVLAACAGTRQTWFGQY